MKNKKILPETNLKIPMPKVKPPKAEDDAEKEKLEAIRGLTMDCAELMDEIDFLGDVALGTRRMISDRPKIKEILESWAYFRRKEEDDYEQEKT